MVPSTKGSILANRLKEIVKQVSGPVGTSIKVIERPGRPLMTGLRHKPEPKHCQKNNCPIEAIGLTCDNQCGIENILYEAICKRCRDKQIDEGSLPEEVTDYLYIGETSRTLAVRSSQHKKDYTKCSNQVMEEEGSSFMWDHHRDVHDLDAPIDPDTDYEFSVLHQHRDPLSRQLAESVRIREALSKGKHYKNKNITNVVSLNRKNEYFQARVRYWD